MDSYVEDSVSISNNVKSRILFYLMIVLAVISLIAMFVQPLIFFIPFAAAVFLAWYFYLGIVIDYDYTFVNDTIDFARVRGRSRRKFLFTVNLSDIEIMARESSPELDGYAGRNLKICDFSSPEEKLDKWQIITNQTAGSKRIVFQPSDEMITEIKRRIPSKVIKKNYGA